MATSKSKFRFQEKTGDQKIDQRLREIEDNFANTSDLDDKDDKVTNIVHSQPLAKDLKDGQKRLYFDGTNYYRYYKIGGKLFRTQLTEV